MSAVKYLFTLSLPTFKSEYFAVVKLMLYHKLYYIPTVTFIKKIKNLNKK